MTENEKELIKKLLNIHDKAIEIEILMPPSPIKRSVIKIGDELHYINKKFNWFNKLMMKLVFGWEVENLYEKTITKISK